MHSSEILKLNKRILNFNSLEYLILVGAILLVLVTGFIKLRRSIAVLIEKHNFVHEFRQKFIEFTNPFLQRHQFSRFEEQQPLDAQLYHWLVSNMDKTQQLLGLYGILAYYTSPFGRFQTQNYQGIINTIPQLRTGEANKDDLLMCEDMMVRYLGAMNRIINQEEKRIKNPVTWLQQGIQFYIAFPVRLLNWFGIISDSSFSNITSSQLFKVFAGIGGLVAFLASLIQIFQAWPFIIGLFSK